MKITRLGDAAARAGFCLTTKIGACLERCDEMPVVLLFVSKPRDICLAGPELDVCMGKRRLEGYSTPVEGPVLISRLSDAAARAGFCLALSIAKGTRLMKRTEKSASYDEEKGLTGM